MLCSEKILCCLHDLTWVLDFSLFIQDIKLLTFITCICIRGHLTFVFHYICLVACYVAYDTFVNILV